MADIYNMGPTVPALFKAHETRHQKAQKRIAELKAENAELRKDAARYRWLRDEKSLEHGIFVYLYVPTLDTEIREYLPDETDAAIDAAMGEQK